jgi:50S ribosomal subunit-associated GTPase HflX
VLSTGKVREIAERCRADRIGAVVFVNALTEHQRLILEERFGCPVLTHADLEQPAR